MECREISELDEIPERQYEIHRQTVASARLDNIVAAMIGSSRTKANELITQGRVFINSEEKTSNSYRCPSDSVFSIRGHGKYRLTFDEGDITKKGPFKEKDKLYKQYHAIIDKLFDKLNLSASQKKLSNFKSNIGKEGNIYREREKLVRAYENMKNEIQTYENNLGFLTSSSKKGSNLVTEMNRKVEKLKADLELILKKIEIIDQSMSKE